MLWQVVFIVVSSAVEETGGGSWKYSLRVSERSLSMKFSLTYNYNFCICNISIWLSFGTLPYRKMYSKVNGNVSKCKATELKRIRGLSHFYGIYIGGPWLYKVICYCPHATWFALHLAAYLMWLLCPGFKMTLAN